MVFETNASMKEVCKVLGETPTGLYDEMSLTQCCSRLVDGKVLYTFACLGEEKDILDPLKEAGFEARQKTSS